MLGGGTLPPDNSQEMLLRTTKHVQPQQVEVETSAEEDEVLDHGTCQKVDLISREEDGVALLHKFLVLESALGKGGSPKKISEDRAKMAVEMANKCQQSVQISKQEH